jgi:hypothetical protein
MSYIRCLCNPESLYVYGGETYHSFSWTDRQGKLQFLNIPNDDFVEFFVRFRKWDDWTAKEYHDLDIEPFECRGITLRKVWFDTETNQILTSEENEVKLLLDFDESKPVDHLVCLSYMEYPPLLMWEVTWNYLRDSAYAHLFRPRWLVRKINQWFG